MVHNQIFVMPTSNKSRAAYVLLFDKLRALDDSEDWASELKKWLIFRKDFLQDVLKEFGVLKCKYCGREDLVEGHHEFHKKHLNMKISNLATVDHVHPLSKGGAKYNNDNCTVACRRCNSKKSDKIIDHEIH